MNKLTKWGLIFQIPNATLLFIFIFYLLIYKVDWNVLSLNLVVWIIFGSIYAITNVASVILLISGFNKE